MTGIQRIANNGDFGWSENGYNLYLGTSSDPNFVVGPYTVSVGVGVEETVSFEITTQVTMLVLLKQFILRT